MVNLVRFILIHASMALGGWSLTLSTFPFKKFVRFYYFYGTGDRERLGDERRIPKGHASPPSAGFVDLEERQSYGKVNTCIRLDVFSVEQWYQCLADEYSGTSIWINPGIAAGIPLWTTLGGNVSFTALTTDVIPDFKREYYRVKYIQHEKNLASRCFILYTKGYDTSTGNVFIHYLHRRHSDVLQVIPPVAYEEDRFQIFSPSCADLGTQKYMPILVGRLLPFYYRVIDRDSVKDKRYKCNAPRVKCNGARLKNMDEVVQCKKDLGNYCKGQQQLAVVDDQLFMIAFRHLEIDKKDTLWTKVPISHWRDQQLSPLTSEYKFRSVTIVTYGEKACANQYLVPYEYKNSERTDISSLVKVESLLGGAIRISTNAEEGEDFNEIILRWNPCWGISLLEEVVFVKPWTNAFPS